MATDRIYTPPGQGLGGKYRKLRVYLEAHPRREWRTSFSNIESILGFELPASARKLVNDNYFGRLCDSYFGRSGACVTVVCNCRPCASMVR